MTRPTPPRRQHAKAVLALRILAAFGAARLLFSFCEYTPWIPKVDFNARYNEVLCLRVGHDPYDVFTDKVSIPCVVSMADLPSIADVPLMQRLPSFPDFGKEDQKEMAIHTYPPWSYAWLLPWTYVSRDVAWIFHLSFEVVTIALLFLLPCRHLARAGDADGFLRLLFVALALNLGKVFPATFMCGNYSTFVAAGALGLAFFLDRDRQVPAGACLALMLLKPQIGAIFTIPLLLGRRFLAVAVAAALCLAGALVASLYCDASVLDLVRHANAAGPRFFSGTALLPARLARSLGIDVAPSVAVPLCAVLGSSVCALVSWRVRRRRSWLERLAPAAICSMFWMVARTYDHAMDLLPLAAVLPALRPRSGIGRPLRLATGLALVAVFLRNLNPAEGDKIRFLAETLATRGLDILPLVHLRTIVANWCWTYQPWLFVPLALLVAESIRRLPDRATPPGPDDSSILPGALRPAVPR